MMCLEADDRVLILKAFEQNYEEIYYKIPNN